MREVARSEPDVGNTGLRKSYETVSTSERGRPRQPEISAAILEAARAELSSHGYSGFSIERVASRAETAKTNVYRRFPSKQQLVFAAAFPASVVQEGADDEDAPSAAEALEDASVPTSVVPAVEVTPCPEDPASGVYEVATTFARLLKEPHSRAALAGLLSEHGVSEEARFLLDGLIAGYRSGMLECLKKLKASASSSSDPGWSPAVVADAVLGMCVARATTGQSLSSRHTNQLLDVLLA